MDGTWRRTWNACESIPYLLETCFALGERVRPCNKFLVWELERHPLEPLPMAPEELLEAFRRILASADQETELMLLKRTTALARDHRLGSVVDAWYFPAIVQI